MTMVMIACIGQDVNIYIGQDIENKIVYCVQKGQNMIKNKTNTKYKNDYNAEHYKPLKINMKIEKRNKIDEYAKKRGFNSSSEYALSLIEKDMAENLMGGGN